MRIAGFFLGLLFLSAAVSGDPLVAQVASQPAISPASQTGSATNPMQATPPEHSSAKRENDDNSSGAGHNLHLRLGMIALGAGYSHLSGPAYYPYGFYPFSPLGGWEYSAFWFPYWGPYPFFAPGYFADGSGKGEIKLNAEPKTAGVYLDRAYAGTADHLKNIWLEPGAYDLSLAASGREDFHQRVYVLSGKSLKITAKLVATEPNAGEAKDKP